MKLKEFFKEANSKPVWYNILAMVLLFIAILISIAFLMDIYTRHGEKVSVPSLRQKSFETAEQLARERGLYIEVSDTGYVKSLPAGTVLEQNIEPGQIVKPGRTIYVVINSLNTPKISLPDIIDNSSLREAMARLKALGFKVGQPQFVTGEKDWVYGVLVNGKNVAAGEKISVDETLIIQVGRGTGNTIDTLQNNSYESTDEGLTEEGTVEIIDATIE